MNISVGMKLDPSGFFFGLSLSSKVVSLHGNEEMEMSQISRAFSLYNKEEEMLFHLWSCSLQCCSE